MLYLFFIYFFLGEWMNSSAGLAFAPHVITIGAGEVVILLQFIRYVLFYKFMYVVLKFFFLNP